MPKRRLSDIAVRYQVLLERLKTGEVRDFVKVFRTLDEATATVIAGLAVENLGQLSKRKLTVILVQLQRENTKILSKATDALFTKLEEVAAQASGFEVETIKQVVKTKVKLKKPTAAEAYKVALDKPLSATGELLKPFVEGWAAKEVQRVNNLVTKGYAEGWTNQKLIQGLRGTRANNFRDGVLEMSRRNAEAVVRTSIQHTATSGRMATFEANDDVVQGYQFVATLDSRTTIICRSLDGREFPLGEGPKPPVHIGCRSTIIAKLDPELDFLDQGATRSSVNGPVPANLTYYDWLKTQPTAFQNEALGKTRATLFRDGGLSAKKFADLNLNKNFQPLTLDQMAKKSPLAFDNAGLNQ